MSGPEEARKAQAGLLIVLLCFLFPPDASLARTAIWPGVRFCDGCGCRWSGGVDDAGCGSHGPVHVRILILVRSFPPPSPAVSPTAARARLPHTKTCPPRLRRDAPPSLTRARHRHPQPLLSSPPSDCHGCTPWLSRWLHRHCDAGHFTTGWRHCVALRQFTSHKNGHFVYRVTSLTNSHSNSIIHRQDERLSISLKFQSVGAMLRALRQIHEH